MREGRKWFRNETVCSCVDREPAEGSQDTQDCCAVNPCQAMGLAFTPAELEENYAEAHAKGFAQGVEKATESLPEKLAIYIGRSGKEPVIVPMTDHKQRIRALSPVPYRSEEEIRREALEEACKAVCPFCSGAMGYSENVDADICHPHKEFPETWRECDAWKIRALAGKEG